MHRAQTYPEVYLTCYPMQSKSDLLVIFTSQYCVFELATVSLPRGPPSLLTKAKQFWNTFDLATILLPNYFSEFKIFEEANFQMQVPVNNLCKSN